MPSSSYSSGFSSRAVISSNLNASDAISPSPRLGRRARAYPRQREATLAVPPQDGGLRPTSVGNDRSTGCSSDPKDSLDDDPERREPPTPSEAPPLPYDYSALEPHIDEQTMHLHHDKHHQAYVDNANKALAGTEWEDRT